MSYKVLARKWRPQVFEDVVGQAHITQSLQNAIKNTSFGHAYLFAGTRGIGKTSCARIFAKALTCQTPEASGNPCLRCNSCKSVDAGTNIDVQEIDGASHNGVENVRALIENAQYLPVGGKFKIYIIDEVHMLSTSAFNALLKTLEEPPAHVIFILATTDPEKLLKTVLSRCQRFDFRTATIDILKTHIAEILKKESIEVESPRIVQTIAKLAKGSFRDGLSLVDQVLSYTTDRSLTEQNVSMALGVAKSSSLREMLSAILLGDAVRLKNAYMQSLNENVDLTNMVQGLLDYCYFVIDRIDSPAALYKHEVVDNGSLDDISGAEIFWIFETLAKDSTWALDALDPDKVMLVVLQKIALRRQFFAQDSSDIKLNSSGNDSDNENNNDEENESINELTEQTAEVSKEEVSAAEVVIQEQEESLGSLESLETLESEPAAPLEQIAEPVVPQDRNRTWDGFLQFLGEGHRALAANLEQGNIIGEPEILGDSVHIVLGFDESSEVFYDHVKEPEMQVLLKENLAKFFTVDLSNTQLELIKLNEEEKKEKNFQSISEIEDIKIQNMKNENMQKIKENPFVKEAQQLFATKVDRVVLNEVQPE